MMINDASWGGDEKNEITSGSVIRTAHLQLTDREKLLLETQFYDLQLSALNATRLGDYLFFRQL